MTPFLNPLSRLSSSRQSSPPNVHIICDDFLTSGHGRDRCWFRSFSMHNPHYLVITVSVGNTEKEIRVEYVSSSAPLFDPGALGPDPAFRGRAPGAVFLLGSSLRADMQKEIGNIAERHRQVAAAREVVSQMAGTTWKNPSHAGKIREKYRALTQGEWPYLYSVVSGAITVRRFPCVYSGDSASGLRPRSAGAAGDKRFRCLPGGWR